MAKPTNPRDTLHVKKALKAHGRARWIQEVLAGEDRASRGQVNVAAPTIVDGLMVVLPGLIGGRPQAVMHGSGLDLVGKDYHEQWAVSLLDQNVAFG